MPIPKHIEEAGRKADELHALVYPQAKAESPGDAAVPEPAQTPAEAPPDESQPATKSEQPHPRDGDAAYWKDRYFLVEGKYNAEVPRLAAELRQRKEAHDKLEARVEEMKAAPTPAPEVVVPPDLVEKYGEEFVQDIRKLMPAAPVQAANAATKADIEELRNREVQRAKKDFFAELTGLVPGWRQLNTDKAFLEWLSGLDEFSGRSRQELFDDAYTSLDVYRVGRFFASFSGTSQSGAEQTPPPPPLEHQLAPAQNRSERAPAGKKVWTIAEINDFYTEARRGAYKGKDGEAKFARIEQDIFAAKREGRLR